MDHNTAENRDSFSGCHPLNNFIFFAVVLLCGMVFMHPVCLGISLLCSLLYAVRLRGWAGVARSFGLILPMALLAAVVNPLFHHAGVTVLAYLPSGNPLTMESLLYGLAAAVMLTAMLLWLNCCSAVLTTDKFVYLFGRFAPALSLLLSMTLRFVPRFRERFRAVRTARGSLRREAPAGFGERLRQTAAELSSVLTWSLEDAIITADSMKSRGYGLPGRTAYSIYRFDRRDRLLLAWLLLGGGVLLLGGSTGGFSWHYYPMLGGSTGGISIALWLVYLLVCLTPIGMERMEILARRRAESDREEGTA